MRILKGRTIPRHVAIIMDGNGRWAELRQKERFRGHIMGAKAVDRVVSYAAKLGINFLTLYAFSSENWNRPQHEVSLLMRLLKRYLSKEIQKMMTNGIRLRAIGEVERLPKAVRRQLEETIDLTKDNRGLTLVLALSYGGRQEIAQAAERLAKRDGVMDDQTTLEHFLWTSDYPDPDLLIRTGGEVRISNFLLWQMAYTEFYFTETLWPDFTNEELSHILYGYGKRERRFGGIHGVN